MRESTFSKQLALILGYFGISANFGGSVVSLITGLVHMNRSENYVIDSCVCFLCTFILAGIFYYLCFRKKDYDKFKEWDFHEYVSEYMDTPAIAESPVNLYCKVRSVTPLGSHDMFLAEITGITVDEAYMDETGKFDLSATDLIAYSHGEYFGLGKKIGKFGYSVKKKK